jgi:hypothetical protein
MARLAGPDCGYCRPGLVKVSRVAAAAHFIVAMRRTPLSGALWLEFWRKYGESVKVQSGK